MALRWGIIGLGKIAHKFTRDLQLLDDHVVVAAASRNINKAEQFASEYGIPKAHGSYRDAFADLNVDIVYIATPHHLHADLSIEAMNAGKHVLCEKPIAINFSQTSAMVDAAKHNNVFLMEGFWTRFNPAIGRICEIIDAGEIGDVIFINADFCFYSEAPAESRVYNLELGGGALLDIGIYPIFLSYLLLGKPIAMQASAQFHSTGADRHTSVILEFEKGTANICGSFACESDMSASICGTKGHLEIDPRWHETEGFTVTRNRTPQHYPVPKLGKGYTHEIVECKRCIDENKIQSDVWSWQNSLDLISILDAVREQIGLRYPFE